MCGRFTQKSERKTISIEFYVQEFISDVFLSYNVAPGQEAGVILRDGETRYDRFKWGLVPIWSKTPQAGRMINARAETVAEKPSFRNGFKKKRCLVPADGFYEWKKTGAVKIPYYIYGASGRPLGMAGLWESWRPKGEEEAQPLLTFTIITTAANARMAELHDRMPVILKPEDRDTWLDSRSDPDDLLELLTPCPPDSIDFHRVSTLVNSPQNNVPACIIPAEEESLF